MIAFSSNKVRSIVSISQFSPGAIKTVAKFTCGGVAAFKLTDYRAIQAQRSKGTNDYAGFVSRGKSWWRKRIGPGRSNKLLSFGGDLSLSVHYLKHQTAL